jgi:hypothetical protein
MLELGHLHGNLGERLLEEAYRRTLIAQYGPNDPRIRMIFDRNLDFIRGEGVWFEAVSLQPTRIDNDACSGLSYALYLGRNPEGEVVVKTDCVRRATVKHRTPQGYTPIRPVRGISFAPQGEAIPIIVLPRPRYAIRLLDDPLPEGEAFAMLEQSFPRLHRQYLTACLAAGICAQAGDAQPPMLVCTGPSGSGKEQHVRLAASFMGQDAVKLAFAADEENFAHRLGIALTTGNSFIIFDELAKTRDLSSRMKSLLMISRSLRWRPLYQNQLVHTTVRAAIFFPTVRLPTFLAASEEFRRRTRRAHLFRRLANWAETSGGDTAAWRDRSEQVSLVANSILTHTWRLSHEHTFRFL